VLLSSTFRETRRQSLEQETAFAAMDPTGSFKSVVWKMCIQIIIYENKKK